MVRRFLRLVAGAAALGLYGHAQADIDRQPVPGFELYEVRVTDPQRYWADHGFELLAPSIRVSVAAHSGARTRIYLKIGAAGEVELRSDDGGALQYPPGSEADRVSLVRYRGSNSRGYTIDDVRGTRWDEQGREWFHVYRASGPEPHAALVGYEWLRDDRRAAREATERLARLVETTLLPNGYRSNRWDVRRFVRLNRCQSCHIANKPTATSLYDRGPPWATDAHGLFTPLAVLRSRAPLSAESAFHDPNANDPYVHAWCGSERATRLGSPGGYYFSCSDGSYPLGTRQLHAEDPYTPHVCASRRFLYARLDARAKAHYRDALDACDAVAPG